MKRYRVDYMDRDGEIITINIKASRVIVDGPLVVFLDEHGEDGYNFLRDDLMNIKEITNGKERDKTKRDED